MNRSKRNQQDTVRTASQPKHESHPNADQVIEHCLRGLDAVLNKGQIEDLEDVVTPNFVDHNAMIQLTPGPNPYKGYLQEIRHAIPDIQFGIRRARLHGDKLLIRWRAIGTWNGDLFGIQPTGRRGIYTGITLARLEDDKIAEIRTSANDKGLLRQLGVIGDPPAVRAGGSQSPG